MNLKSVSLRLSKKDMEIIQILCADYGETTTNIIKHALHFLYDARTAKSSLVRRFQGETSK